MSLSSSFLNFGDCGVGDTRTKSLTMTNENPMVGCVVSMILVVVTFVVNVSVLRNLLHHVSTARIFLFGYFPGKFSFYSSTFRFCLLGLMRCIYHVLKSVYNLKIKCYVCFPDVSIIICFE